MVHCIKYKQNCTTTTRLNPKDVAKTKCLLMIKLTMSNSTSFDFQIRLNRITLLILVGTFANKAIGQQLSISFQILRCSGYFSFLLHYRCITTDFITPSENAKVTIK